MTEYVTPNVKPPQLSDADLARLTPEQINRARKLGQLEDVLSTPSAKPNPSAPDQAVPASLWDRMTEADKNVMRKAYGPDIDPTHH